LRCCCDIDGILLLQYDIFSFRKFVESAECGRAGHQQGEVAMHRVQNGAFADAEVFAHGTANLNTSPSNPPEMA
jgi:hypothetical protein